MKTHAWIFGVFASILTTWGAEVPEGGAADVKPVAQEGAADAEAPGEVTPTDVQLGDSRADVLRILGAPSGEGRFDNRSLLSYPRGTVLLEEVNQQC